MLYRRSQGQKAHFRAESLSIFILKCMAVGAVAAAFAAGTGAQGPTGSAGRISGRVFLDGSRRPASQVAVSLRSGTQQIFRSVLTDYDGRFEVADLPDGAYEVVVEEPGCEPERVSANVEGSAASVAVHLKPYAPAEKPGNRYSVSVRELLMPDKARNEFQKGLQRIAKNEFADGLRHFTKATEAFPGYYEAFHFMGIAEMRLGQLDKAVGAFQRSVDLSGGRYAAAIFGMGYASYLQGNLKEAEAILRRGLEVDGDSADGHFYLGMTLFLEDRIDEAEKSARQALLRRPDYAAPYIVLADVYGRRRQFREQVRALDAYLKLSPKGPFVERAKEARQATLDILASLEPVN